MELLHGETLAERLKKTGRLTTETALSLVRQMSSALSAAHSVGIIHRDFKPANVILVDSQVKLDPVRAVVTDFGLASRSLASSQESSIETQSLTHEIRGTLLYMAPEQVRGLPATVATDVYAFGPVIYEMVTGCRPFHGDAAISAAVNRLSDAPIPPHRVVFNLSPVWEEVILRCLEREPTKRFGSIQDVVMALESGQDEPDIQPRYEQQARVLEAAAPRQSTVGCSTEVIAMLRCIDSRGLRKLLDEEEVSALKPDDVRERPLELEFPLGPKGNPQATEILLRLESPNFEPTSQCKVLKVPPKGDSALCAFLVTPRIPGELLLNLELLKGQEVVASRSIRTRAEFGQVTPPVAKDIVTIPLVVLVQESRASLPNEITLWYSKTSSATSLTTSISGSADSPMTRSSPQKRPDDRSEFSEVFALSATPESRRKG
jgi:serine/threonine protein kinase